MNKTCYRFAGMTRPQLTPDAFVPLRKIGMNRKAVACFLALLACVSSARGQETRTFPEAQCTYTLPGPDWEFLDPKLLTVDMGAGTNLVLTRAEKGGGFLLRSVPDRVLPMTPGHRDELVKDLGLLLLGRLLVALTQRPEHLRSRLPADRVVHRVPPEVGNILLRQQHVFSNRIVESMRWGRLIVADHDDGSQIGHP
jgi:hypothetical protein